MRRDGGVVSDEAWQLLLKQVNVAGRGSAGMGGMEGWLRVTVARGGAGNHCLRCQNEQRACR